MAKTGKRPADRQAGSRRPVPRAAATASNGVAAAPRAAGAPVPDAPPPAFGTAGRVGFWVLLAALALAPILGGAPSGAAYGNDANLGLLRVLVLLAGMICAFADRRPTAAPATERPADAPGRIGNGARAALWALFGLTLLSLLVHSRLLTRPVLLFTMLPATLDWMCYAVAFTLVLRRARADDRAPALLSGALIAGAAWVALAGAREYGESVQAGFAAERVKATFFSENFTAGFLALSLPVAVARFLDRRAGLLETFALGAVAVLTCGTLVATGSRLGVIAAVAGLVPVVLAGLSARGVFPAKRAAGLLLAALVLAWGFRGPLIGRVSGGGGAAAASGGAAAPTDATQSHSGAFRAWTWKGTARMAAAHPVLGTGPGTFAVRYPPYARVARTDLAHSSYLQLAAEQGFPALLAALAAVGLSLAAGGRAVLAWWSRRRRRDLNAGGDGADDARGLLLCGLLGGVLAGALRSAFDSEWSLLGNALPFWALAGMVAGVGATAPAPGARETHPPPPAPRRPVGAVAAGAGMAAALALAVLLLANVVRRDDALGRARNAAGAGPDDVAAARTAAGAWPPDPDALGAYARLVDIETATGLRERAARIEPSGKRFYDLARLYAFRKRDADALDAFRRAAEAEPTRLQTLRALAETQEQAGDRAGALETWRRLAALHEGPVGRVRAIPELPEIHPAFAYAALADHAAARGDAPAALDLYGKAAAVVEDYADTTPVYQRLEVASALVQGMDLAGRRRELRALYERVQERSEALLRRQGGPEAAARIDALRRRRDATLGQLDRLLTRPDAG